jgi:PAS domain-containing protein
MHKFSFRPFILPLLLIICSLFYYFGELIDWAAWDSLRKTFFYGVHDIHRLLFLAPIIYAAYTARVKGAIILTLISFLIFLPRAFFISPYPDPLLRMVIFTAFAGIIGYLVARIRNEQTGFRKLEADRTLQRDTMLSIINNISDGVFIAGPDYRILYMNTRLKNEFGEGVNLPCHNLLKNQDAPCEGCEIQTVIKTKESRQWECRFPDGRTFAITAAPYLDDDGNTCQIAVLKDTSADKLT